MYDREYHKKYQEDNKEAIRKQRKEYREKNKEKVAESKRKYYSTPEAKAKKAKAERVRYLEKRELYLANVKARRKERKQFIDEVSLRYGCQNPDCKWDGEFDPCQLTFHHFNPSEKEKEVAKMHSWSYSKIIEEINKCVVLCRNCHPLADRNEIEIDETMLCEVENEMK